MSLEDRRARLLKLADASPPGLRGSIRSSDKAAARDLAERMDAGGVWIDRHAGLDPTVPFGGTKHSGLGIEFAQEGLSEFAQIQVINEAR